MPSPPRKKRKLNAITESQSNPFRAAAGANKRQSFTPTATDYDRNHNRKQSTPQVRQKSTAFVRKQVTPAATHRFKKESKQMTMMNISIGVTVMMDVWMEPRQRVIRMQRRKTLWMKI
eukprot:1020279_1